MALILIVEDDSLLAKTMSRWLEFNKHTTDLAESGTVALEKMQQGSFDLILLDWQLPDIEGIQVLTRFRQNGGNTPVLMMTGMRDKSEVDAGMSAGASDYLTKPFKLDELSARVAALLE
jgi:DNA-binding response OmpR family regulator